MPSCPLRRLIQLCVPVGDVAAWEPIELRRLPDIPTGLADAFR